MKKMLQWVSYLVGILVVFLALVIGGVVLLVQPNHFKSLLSDRLYQATGLRVHFSGDIRFSFYPILGLKVNQVEITKPAEKTSRELSLASVEHFVVGVKLLPLISHQIEVSELYLDGAVVHLEQDASGRFNWAVSTDKEDQKENSISDKSSGSSDKSGKVMTLSIPALEVNRMTVTWFNRQNSQQITLQGVQLSAHDVGENKPFPAYLSLYVDSVKPEMRGPITVHTTVRWSKASSSIVFDDIQMDTKLTGRDLPEDHITSMLKGRLSVSDQRIDLSALDATFNQNHITGVVTVHNISTWDTEANLKVSPLGYESITAKAATLQGRVATKGAGSPSLRTLFGSVRFSLSDGSYKGVNMLYLIDVGKSILQVARGVTSFKLPSLPTHMDRTSFGSMTGSGTITQGVLNNSDFVLSSPALNATGSGSVDLASQKINYRLLVSKADENDIEKQNIPVVITGTLSDPKVDVDKGSLLKHVGQSLISTTVSTLLPVPAAVSSTGKGLDQLAKQFLKQM